MLRNLHSSKSIIALAAAIREQGNSLIMECLSRQGITDLLPAHGAVLYALLVQSPLQMGELADIIGRKKNTVTSLINTLENRGYCRRETSTEDARVQLVFLTAKGQSLRRIQNRIAEDVIRQAWSGVDEESRNTCVRVLQTVLANLVYANVVGLEAARRPDPEQVRNLDIPPAC